MEEASQLSRRKLSLIAIFFFLFIFTSFPIKSVAAAPASSPKVWNAHVYLINCSDAYLSSGAQVSKYVYNTLTSKSVNGSVIKNGANNLTVDIHIHWINSTSQLASTFSTLSNDTTSLMAKEGFGPIIFFNCHGSDLPIPEPGNQFIDNFLYNDPGDTYVSVSYPTPKPTWWSYLTAWGQQIQEHGWTFVNVIGWPFENLTNTPYDRNTNKQNRWGIEIGTTTTQGSGPYPINELGLKSFLAPANITVSNTYGSSTTTGTQTTTGSSIASKWHQTFPSSIGVSYQLSLLPSSISPNFTIYSSGGNPYVAALQMGGGMYVQDGFTEPSTNYTAVGQVAAIAGLEAGWRLSVNSLTQALGSLTVNVYNDAGLTQRVSDRYVVSIFNASSGRLIINQTTWLPQVSYYFSPGSYKVEVTRFYVTYDSVANSLDVIPEYGITPINETVNSGQATVLNAVVPVAPGVPVSIPRGTYVFVLNCSDAPSWWVGSIVQVVNGFTSVMKKAGTMFNIIYVNTTQQLYGFMNNQNVTSSSGRILRPGFEYRLQYAVFMNGHGEAVPIPSQYVSGTTPNWQSYFTFISNQIKKYCWTWVSIAGYPFYYVSNHAYDSSWQIYNVTGLYSIGSSGLNQFLGTSVDCFWEDDSPISVVGQMTQNFWVACKAFNITGISPLVLGYRPFPSNPPSGYTYALPLYQDIVGGEQDAVTMQMGSQLTNGYFVDNGLSRHMNDTMKGEIAAMSALSVWFRLGLTWINVIPVNPPASGITIVVWVWSGTWLVPLNNGNITLPAGITNYTFDFVPPYGAASRYIAMVYYNNVYAGSNSVVIPRGGVGTVYVNAWNAPKVVNMPEFDVLAFFSSLLIGASLFLWTAKRLRLVKHRKGISVVISAVIMVVIVVLAAILFNLWYTRWLSKYSQSVIQNAPSTQQGYEMQLFSPITVATSGTQTIIMMHYLNTAPESTYISAVYVNGQPVPIASPTQSQSSNFYVLSWNPMPSSPNVLFATSPIPGTVVPQLYIVLNYYQPQSNIVVEIVTSDGHSAVSAIYVPYQSGTGIYWQESFEAGSLTATDHYWTTSYAGSYISPYGVNLTNKWYQDGFHSLNQSVTMSWLGGSTAYASAIYDFGSSNNPDYPNVPMKYNNLSLYLRGNSTSGTCACQVSLKIVNQAGATIGELIYYWGSSSATHYMFSSTSYKPIQVSSSIPMGSWQSFSRNWTQDVQTQFPGNNVFFIDSMGLQVGAYNWGQNGYTRVCWDNIRLH
jgi:hypothetical protein